MASAKPAKQSPADVARETFRQLSLTRTQPTPDAYRKLYNEIAGISDEPENSGQPRSSQQLALILRSFASSLARESKDYLGLAQQLALAAENEQWSEYQKALQEFIEKIFAQIESLNKRIAAQTRLEPIDAIADHERQESLLKDLLTRTLALALPSLLNTAPELSAESDALSRLLKNSRSEKELLEIGTRLKNLCFKIEKLPVTPLTAIPTERSPLADPLIPILSKLLSQTLNMAVSALLEGDQKLQAASDQLATQVNSATSLPDFQEIETRLKELCYKISLKGDDTSEQLQLLLSLFKLLLENVSSLLEDDNWLRGQVMVIQELITGNIDHRALLAATKGLKEVIYRQSALKDSIDQNKISVKQLMNLFVERLNVFAQSTGAYHEKITAYTGKITPQTRPEEINHIIDSLLADTLEVQSETKQSFEVMLTAQKEVQDAENRVLLLERKLADMSDQVLKDQLTGTLNRRGLDELLDREAARADRRNTPLCFGMLDIDNFKKLNDTYGHVTGDEALIHLVNVIKKTLRTVDIVARYGGEEFAVIMPETELQHAADTMMRVQRELTKHFFMAGEEQVLITFSAGVAQRHPAEELAPLIVRADKAMYEAKAAGKNRVITAH